MVWRMATFVRTVVSACAGGLRRTQEVVSVADVSRQEWPQRERLTFDTKDGIIIVVERLAVFPQARRYSRSSSALFIFHPLIIRKSVFSQPLRGG